jgi:hypothetical protein
VFGPERCSASFASEHWGLFDLDTITHHPQFELLKTLFPTIFELSHPLAVPCTVGYIHDNPYQVIPIENPTVTPVAFHFLRLVTRCTKVIDDFEDRFRNPFSRDIAAIIEPEG